MYKKREIKSNALDSSGGVTQNLWLWKGDGQGGQVPYKPALNSIEDFFLTKFDARRVGRSLYVFDKKTDGLYSKYWRCISSKDLDAWVTNVLAGETGGYAYVNYFKSATVADVRNYLTNRFKTVSEGKGCNNLGVIDGYIPCENGIYNLKSGEIEPHSSYFGFESGLDVDFMSSSWGIELETPHFDKFMDEICLDNGVLDSGKRKMMLELAGLCLSGIPNSKAQYIFILTGGGGNGKSVYCKILQMLTGSSNSILSTDELRANSSQSLDGSFVNIMEEQISNLGRRDWSLLKSLSSGTSFTIKQKYVDDKTIVPTAKVVMVCNKLPSLQEDNEAIRRRLRVLKLKNSFIGREDKHLLSKIRPELTGILDKAINAYKDFVKRGYKFEDVQSVLDASSEHQATGRETYKMFVDDCLELSTNRNVYVKKDYLHKIYNSWCDLVLGKSTYGREKLTSMAPSIKEYLGELARNSELFSHLDIAGANLSASGDGTFKRRMFSGEHIHALFHVRPSKSGWRHLRSSFKGEALPSDIPFMDDADSEAQVQATKAQNYLSVVKGGNND